jgi:ATP-dependent Clp endopeptidase proteolytic subunit ClpP|tara:strand:+ start:499 stop:1170 length:672 start_codon:yes stop_codon:yes gene_type:complete
MIKRIKEVIKTLINDEKKPEVDPPDATGKKMVILDPTVFAEELMAEPEPMNTIGLFCDVTEEKVAEVVHGLLYLDHLYNNSEPEKRKPIDFYVSTYGGSADDMFSLYDVMRNVKKNTEIHTIGMGKVMSAGVLILAAGTQGKRKIGKNCRVMIHSVLGANHGSLHNMINEMEAIEQLQEMYIGCLSAETKMSRSQIKKMLARKINVYLTAEEAVELGIADIVI